MESGIACKSLTADVTDIDRFVRFSGLAVFYCHYIYNVYPFWRVNSCSWAIRKIIASWMKSVKSLRSMDVHPFARLIFRNRCKMWYALQNIGRMIYHGRLNICFDNFSIAAWELNVFRIKVQRLIVPEKSRNHGTIRYLLSIPSAFIFSLIYGGTRMLSDSFRATD